MSAPAYTAVIDTETTGLLLPSAVPLDHQPRVIELGILIVHKSKIVCEHGWLINPEIALTPIITKITGISDADLVGQPTFTEIAHEVREALRSVVRVIAHNAPFDVTMIQNEFTRAGITDFEWPKDIVCTVQEYYHLKNYRLKLQQLYEIKMGKPLDQKHRALDDCRAVFEILVKDNFFTPTKGLAAPCTTKATNQSASVPPTSAPKPRQSMSLKKTKSSK